MRINLEHSSQADALMDEGSGIVANLAAFANAILGKESYPISSNQILYGIAVYEGIVTSVKTQRTESILGII